MPRNFLIPSIIPNRFKSLGVTIKTKRINNTKPAMVTVFFDFILISLPLIFSIAKNNKWPPSKAGMGRILNKAKLIESIAIN